MTRERKREKGESHPNKKENCVKKHMIKRKKREKKKIRGKSQEMRKEKKKCRRI